MTVIETTEKIVDVPVVKQIEVPQVTPTNCLKVPGAIAGAKSKPANATFESRGAQRLCTPCQVQTIEKIVEIPLAKGSDILHATPSAEGWSSGWLWG